jgi:hypothetical protein
MTREERELCRRSPATASTAVIKQYNEFFKQNREVVIGD